MNHPSLPTPLSFDSTIAVVRAALVEIADHRVGRVKYALADVLLWALAIFTFKYPSLLRFEADQFGRDNLAALFGVGRVPSDTTMREALDGVDWNLLRPDFTRVFAVAQRVVLLDKYRVLDGRYALAQGRHSVLRVEPGPLRPLRRQASRRGERIVPALGARRGARRARPPAGDSALPRADRQRRRRR